MDLVDLVQLVVAGEERYQGDDFEHDTADSPEIHFLIVVAVGEEALGSAVPPGGDIPRECGGTRLTQCRDAWSRCLCMSRNRQA